MDRQQTIDEKTISVSVALRQYGRDHRVFVAVSNVKPSRSHNLDGTPVDFSVYASNSIIRLCLRHSLTHLALLNNCVM